MPIGRRTIEAGPKIYFMGPICRYDLRKKRIEMFKGKPLAPSIFFGVLVPFWFGFRSLLSVGL